jgi:NAD(P)-dependent dehydrogenase (short-subunit alcohol dehydrogenase family)
VAVAFAKEGADVAIAYLSEIEDSDAAHTAELVNTAGQRCVTIRGDLAVEDNIINTSSINGLCGNKTLIDYAATKGAVLALTYSLAQALQDRGIRVNAVAPGPVWTPLIPATFGQERVGPSAARCPWAAPPTRTRSPRPTSSSPAGSCPAAART